MGKDQLSHGQWWKMYAYVRETTGADPQEALSFMDKYEDTDSEIIMGSFEEDCSGGFYD